MRYTAARPPVFDSGDAVNWDHPFSRGLVLALANLPGTVCGAGGRWPNLTGKTPAGTLVNGPTWGATPYERCVNFDGTNDYINLGRPAALNLTSAYTIAVLCRTNTTTGLRNAIYTGTASGGQYGIVLNGSAWLAQSVNGAPSNVNGQNLTANVDYLLGVSLSEGTMTTYTNGVLNNSGSIITTTVANDINIGADIPNGRYWSGPIYAVYMWNRGMTARDHRWLNQNRFGMFKPVTGRTYFAPLSTTPSVFAPAFGPGWGFAA